ncbi:MAG: hypothetical protein Q8O10_10240 [candidate division Zixibacteria bacterium]|nr:hypothetical protein [candidate division Zixibacteria bacterium]
MTRVNRKGIPFGNSDGELRTHYLSSGATYQREEQRWTELSLVRVPGSRRSGEVNPGLEFIGANCSA